MSLSSLDTFALLDPERSLTSALFRFEGLQPATIAFRKTRFATTVPASSAGENLHDSKYIAESNDPRGGCCKPDIAARHTTSRHAAVSNKTTRAAVGSANLLLNRAKARVIASATSRYGPCLVNLGQVSEDTMRTSFESPPPIGSDRIFVVESDEVIRSALQFILGDAGEIHGFINLDRAFAWATELTPDIVLLGVGVLKNNGERTLAEIARRWNGAIILIVANSVKDPLALAALKWGAHDVLGKPITFDGVRAKVDGLLRPESISPAMLGLLPLSAAW
jgi:CheY-like chemotaxis protein